MPWVRNAVEESQRIMGFGHAVSKTDDPRSLMLRDIARRQGGPLVDFAIEVEGLIVDTLAELKPGRELYANVEYYAGVVMSGCGIPPELFTPTFAVSRTMAGVRTCSSRASTTGSSAPAPATWGLARPSPSPRSEARAADQPASGSGSGGLAAAPPAGGAAPSPTAGSRVSPAASTSPPAGGPPPAGAAPAGGSPGGGSPPSA